MELKVIYNNCFCDEICVECGKWFDCSDFIAYKRCTEEDEGMVCPSCFLKLQEKMRLFMEQSFGQVLMEKKEEA